MFTQKEHWNYFAEFCRLEKDSGGPDPQLEMIHHVALPDTVRTIELHECWVGGCYISVYNVPYSEAILHHWSVQRALKAKRHEMFQWLKAEWESITTRVERRCVRRQDWMAEFFNGYIHFMKEEYLPLKERCVKLPREDAYIEAWNTVTQVPRLGRYVALKLLEYLKRYDGLAIEAPDIRPKDGWSPRRTLSVLWDRPQIDAKDNSPELLATINGFAKTTQKRLRDEFNVKVSLFELQVLLCEYRECYEGERQYPGRSLDSELKYGLKAGREWPFKSLLWDVRADLFPRQHLGELNGWEGPREGPARTLARLGYMWSDLRYDFSKTEDFARPAVHKGIKPPTVRERQNAAGGNKISAPRQNAAPRVYEIIPGKLYQSGRWVKYNEEACRSVVTKYGLTGVANFWKPDERLSKLVNWYRLWPLQDGRRILPEVVTLIAAEVADQIEANGPVLTMCYGGKNRSGLISALVAKRLLGITGKQAYELVKKARRGALVNQYFADFLIHERGFGRVR